jgi:amino acid adenylation domain-containing protein
MQIFHETALKFPNKTAVSSDSESITYKELESQSNKIASFLENKGTKKEDIIAVFADRSVNTIVTIIGILKSGASYLPVDVLYPDERIKYLIEKGNAKFVVNYHLARKSTIEMINQLGTGLVDISKVDGFSDEYVERRGSNSCLAYVIFTSGSEGNPKGVMIEDKGIVRLVYDEDHFPIKSEWNVLQSGTVSFDASVFDIFGALLNGSTLHLCEQETLLSSERLKDSIDSKHINMMFMTTPLFHQLVNVDPYIFENLECFVVGGDKLFTKDAEIIKKLFPKLRMFNAYGPTENSVISTLYEVPENPEDNIPIGTAISHSTAYILDENMNMVSVGEVGELYTGGVGVGRGYINDSEKTALKFLDDPFSGGRMYRTGDLATWDKDGNILFMGRADSQIKLRGFRIELQEIQNVISGCNNVHDCHVMCQDNDGEKNLLAFVQLSHRTDFDYVQTLKDEIKLKLPAYMIPEEIIIVENIPLKLNGKVDATQLINYRNTIKNSKQSNSSDNLVINILNELLNTNVDMDDDIYEAGLNSLSAIKVVSELKKHGYDITIRDIFTIEKVRELVEIVSEKSRDKLA